MAPDALPIPANELRVFIYDTLIGAGHSPTSAEIGAHFRVSAAAARDAMRRLGIGKTLIPDPGSGEIWMASPFSARPSAYWVTSGRKSWWANCAWDMFGIAAMVREKVDIEATCTDCGEPMHLRVHPQTGPEPGTEGIVHFLVPAHRWYEDIGFT